MVILGCYFLLFGFFGFNGGSQLHISQVGDGAAVALICVNTIISGSFGGVSSLIWTKLFHNHWSLVSGTNHSTSNKWSYKCPINAAANHQRRACWNGRLLTTDVTEFDDYSKKLHSVVVSLQVAICSGK